MGSDVADLRTSLRHALDEAERLAATGRHELAAGVLEDQRTALADLHARLSQRLAGAAVEREAEHVLSVAEAPAEARTGAHVGWHLDMTALRLLVSAVTATVGLTILP